jgi:methenyltetrahydromethanopterin cyclohydrolase
MKSLGFYLLATTLFTLPLQAQLTKPVASTTEQLMSSVQERNSHRAQSLLHSYPVRNVGPVTMSGRVSDIAVHPDTARIFYVGFGSAGIFKTTNGGATMEPIFDNRGGAMGYLNLTQTYFGLVQEKIILVAVPMQVPESIKQLMREILGRLWVWKALSI